MPVWPTDFRKDAARQFHVTPLCWFRWPPRRRRMPFHASSSIFVRRCFTPLLFHVLAFIFTALPRSPHYTSRRYETICCHVTPSATPGYGSSLLHRSLATSPGRSESPPISPPGFSLAEVSPARRRGVRVLFRARIPSEVIAHASCHAVTFFCFTSPLSIRHHFSEVFFSASSAPCVLHCRFTIRHAVSRFSCLLPLKSTPLSRCRRCFSGFTFLLHLPTIVPIFSKILPDTDSVNILRAAMLVFTTDISLLAFFRSSKSTAFLLLPSLSFIFHRYRRFFRFSFSCQV